LDEVKVVEVKNHPYLLLLQSLILNNEANELLFKRLQPFCCPFVLFVFLCFLHLLSQDCHLIVLDCEAPSSLVDLLNENWIGGRGNESCLLHPIQTHKATLWIDPIGNIKRVTQKLTDISKHRDLFIPLI